jgi:hypothetical protein
MGKLTRGLAAGAAGTALLNAVTYLDMAARGRPASSVPEDDIDRMLARAGVSLGEGERAQARRSGLASLSGYLTGFAAGAAFGLVRPLARGVPAPAAAVLTGLAVMAATDSASVRLGTTDPREWSAVDWASDVIPHLAYGAGVVLTYDALR